MEDDGTCFCEFSLVGAELVLLGATFFFKDISVDLSKLEKGYRKTGIMDKCILESYGTVTLEYI